MSEKRAFTVKELCDQYGISRTTFYQERKQGRLRTVKVGRRTLVLVDDASAWAAQLQAA
jgi:excisionase family DNA binding protein